MSAPLPWDKETDAIVQGLKKRPVDRWGWPMFCRDCPNRKFDGPDNKGCKQRKAAHLCKLTQEHLDQSESEQ